MKQGYNISSIFGLLLVLVCIVVFGQFSQSKSFQTIEVSGVEYNGVATNPSQGGGAQRITGPVSVKEIKYPLDLKNLDISFEFSTQEPTFSYGNLFQTGDSIDAIRMELQPSSNLVLILGEGKLFNLSKAIQLAKYHAVRLNYEKSHFLKIFIDGKEVLDITDKEVLSGKFDLSNIVLGAGLARQRVLVGSVKNFSLSGAYSYYGRTANLSRWMFIFLCGIVFLMSLPRGRIFDVAGDSNTTPTSSDLTDNIAMYGSSLAFVAVGLFSIRYFGERHLGLSKWLVHLMLPISMAVTFLVVKWQGRVWKWVRWPLGMIFFGYVTFTLSSTGHNSNVYDAFTLGLFLFSLLAFVLPLTRSVAGLSLSQRGVTRLTSGFAVGISGLFLALSWIALVDLMNWNALRQMLDNNFGVTVVGACLILRYLVAALFAPENSAETTIQDLSTREKVRCLLSRASLDIAIIAVFFWISFRHDSLFIPGSEYHWEYFVGVVQGVRNGGWLLWDTPSQYGFLNILLASLVPSASAWQAFYIFQGILLFLVSTCIYIAARRYASRSLIQRLAIFSIVFMTLFFADPEFIGPYPFPSSSVVRFFCVYALVLVAWFIPKFGLRQAIALSIAWSLAVIWSAESAVYGTIIFLFILVALLQTRTAENHPFALAGKYVAIAAICLATVLAIIFSFYFARLGVAPDLVGYFEYAVGYASGYGYVPFSLSGPGNLLLLVFMSISILCIGAIQRGDGDTNVISPLAAMAGSIWGISTYYIGRPVPQNITAMLPLIAMVVYLSFVLSKRTNIGRYSLPIKATALPLFFLVLIPLFNPKWVANLGHMQFFTPDIATKLPKAGNDLQRLLARVNPSAVAPIVYYGDDAAPPIFSGGYAKLNETNWLPIPLQLLEPPLSEARRGIYLQRYICRNQLQEGILINRMGDAIEVRLQGFLRELRQYYDHVDVIPGNEYKLYHFSGINLQHCLTVGGKSGS